VENRKTSISEEVNGKVYLINKTSPRTACWLFTFLGSRSAEGERIIAALGRCTREQYDEIQDIVLKLIFLKDGDFPISVVNPKTGELLGDLVDPAVLMRLTSLALTFQLESFMVANESKPLKSADQPGTSVDTSV
jgi:hypothetical protein